MSFKPLELDEILTVAADEKFPQQIFPLAVSTVEIFKILRVEMKVAISGFASVRLVSLCPHHQSEQRRLRSMDEQSVDTDLDQVCTQQFPHR